MQLQGELQEKGHQPHHYRGPVHGVSVIVRNEGLRGIYRGLGCAYVYQLLLNGCRLGFYEPMRNGLAELLYKDGNVQHPGINMLCGASSGVIGAAAGSPFFLVKTRLQSFSPSRPVGTQHRYVNALDGLSQIYRAEGFRGLYRGVGAATIRTGFGSSVQLPTYFFAKRQLIGHLGMQEGPALHLTSSSCSGFVVCIFMHPPGKMCRGHRAADGTDAKTIYRYDHVPSVQSERKPVQRCPRLLGQDHQDRGSPRDLQRLSTAFGEDIAAYHPHLEFGRADEQADEKPRRPDIARVWNEKHIKVERCRLTAIAYDEVDWRPRASMAAVKHAWVLPFFGL